MNMFCSLLLVINLCIVGTISQTVVRGVVGQEITLPCSYSVRGGTTHMCWGQGSCPNSKCSNEILRTDGRRVTSRTSSRYQLRGWITRGDVSLTIVNLKEGDKGMYCCRIEVPGWFNDLKKTLNLQVGRATTTTSQTTTTTKSHPVPITTTSVPPMTTASPPTAFLLTAPSAVPPVPPLTTNVPPMSTSSMKEATEVLTSDPPFVNINPSKPNLQTVFGYNYNFLTTESEIATSTAVTTSPPWTLLTHKNTENIENQPTSVPITTYPAAITNMSHTAAMLSAMTPLTTTVTIPITYPFISPTTSSSPTVSAVALPITNVSSMTTSSASTAVALLTSSPLLVNTKSLSTSPQHECIEHDSSLTPEAVASSTGMAQVWKILSHNHAAVSCAVVVLVLLLVVLLLIVKRKNITLYQCNKAKSVNEVEEPEKMLIGMEGDNGIFAL
ncbi:T-cell immunoglobulin and mucin domain-containing protein 4-like isoform X1 [Heteronotia binoei]|uniref:T-cell immunoglobulin and mucin domain-containing protein 4-like isoform X1 n=1 Tax=Heteronotia binoei TaxID=13085 RepID=UPI0029313DC6|nr:T-cell immunoglobulin and mucin domain-containing protein 4-like isoform X1 [Heteronotia binoei]